MSWLKPQKGGLGPHVDGCEATDTCGPVAMTAIVPAQAKVQALEDQVHALTARLKDLEMERAHNTAQLDLLAKCAVAKRRMISCRLRALCADNCPAWTDLRPTPHVLQAWIP